MPTSATREGVQLVKKRGKPLRRIGFRILGIGAVTSLAIDSLTWILTREGNPVRISIALLLLGGAAMAIGAGSVLDRLDRRKLGL